MKSSCWLLLIFLIHGSLAFGIEVDVLPNDQMLEEATLDYDPFDGAILVQEYSFEQKDDRDFDQQPDDWLRRIGVEFPQYVDMEIDRKVSAEGTQSLRIDANGGKATYYSPLIRIDDLHSYVFQAKAKSEGLKNDAFVVSISFLNDQRQRVQRFLTQPVTGNSEDWLSLQLGPLTPLPDVRFVVIGCHLIHSDKMDISGSAWIDSIWLGRLPRFFLESNFETQFLQTDSTIQIKSYVTGLDNEKEGQNSNYHLFLRINDINGKEIDRRAFLLRPDSTESLSVKLSQRDPIPWNVPKQPPGYYRITSQLQREGRIVIKKNTSFAVLDLHNDEGEIGEFGLSVPKSPDQSLPVKDFVSIMVVSGSNWIKYPLWDFAENQDTHRQVYVGSLLDGMIEKNITPIGMLNHPPTSLREKFPVDWQGISEIFTMPSTFWQYSVDEVMAKFSGNVRYWQLGEDTDKSFVGLTAINQTLSVVKSEFDRIGRDTRVGVHWDWEQSLPNSPRANEFFLVLNSETTQTPEKILSKLRATADKGYERWVLLTPLSATNTGTLDDEIISMEVRASDLVKRMTVAKVGGAEKIFASSIFDPDTGLLHEDGSPTELFVPWRTTATALRNAQFIGSLQLPNSSTNYLFSQNGKVTMVVWNEEPVEEEVYLGDLVDLNSIWGHRQRLTFHSGAGQRFQVTREPQIITNCNESLVKFQMAVEFERGRLPSSTEYQQEAILGVNTFSSGTSGQIVFNPPKEWDVDPKTYQFGLARGEEFRMPMIIKLPASTSLGRHLIPIEFRMDDEQIRFNVYRYYEIGIGDIEVTVEVFPDPETKRLIVEQTIINKTQPPERLDFRCSLDVRGRRRQYKNVTKLDSGQTVTKSFYIENPETLTDFTFKLRAEQIDGRRVLNYIWTPEENDR